jgi:DNA-binding response OmpR family regulator
MRQSTDAGGVECGYSKNGQLPRSSVQKDTVYPAMAKLLLISPQGRWSDGLRFVLSTIPGVSTVASIQDISEITEPGDPPDLIVLNNDLGEMSGSVAVLEALAGQVWHVPTLFLANDLQEEKQARNQAATQVLQKGFSCEQLEAAIVSLLGDRGSEPLDESP